MPRNPETMFYVCVCGARRAGWGAMRDHHKGCLSHLTRNPVPHESRELTGDQCPPHIKRSPGAAGTARGASHKEKAHG